MHSNNLNPINLILYTLDHFEQDPSETNSELNRDFPGNNDVLPRDGKRRRRPDINQDHKGHHHGEWHNEKEKKQEIGHQIEESKDKIDKFMIEKHGESDVQVDGGNKPEKDTVESNQEMMMKFFDKDAASRIKDMKMEHQEILRNAVAGKTQQNNGNAVSVNCTETKKEPYFENTREADKKGPGSMGGSGKIEGMTDKDKQREKDGYKKHSFNEYLSRKISLHRSLQDPRYPE